MQLTRQTDLAFRLLTYLAENPRFRWVPVREVSEAHGVSHNHMLKVVRQLAINGYIDSKRGVAGGVRLSREPEQIRIGDVLRHIEPSFRMLPTGDALEHPAVTRIQRAMHDALGAFFQELDGRTLADFVFISSPVEAITPIPQVRQVGPGVSEPIK